MVLIALASVIWTPIGIYVGLRPKPDRASCSRWRSSWPPFPTICCFPLVVSLIVFWNANPDIWLSPLIVLGTQWYILFNVIAGASTMPQGIARRRRQFRRPWLAVVAQGRAARGVSLLCHRRHHRLGRRLERQHAGGSRRAGATHTLHAHGLGAYIADAITAGDFHRVVLGIAVMSFFVVVVNRLLWRPLYWYAERKFRLT